MVNPVTPYPKIDLLLDHLLSEIQAVLGTRLVGLYLHGSLAYGDFDPQSSDIDFLAVTRDAATEADFALLKEMHSRLRAGPSAWAQKLEGAYLPRKDLRRHDPEHAPVPWLGVDGHFGMERLGSDWIIQRWILREIGIPVFGPPLKEMIDPVSADELRGAVRSSLREWWSPPFPSPERFQDAGYRAYAVLTMCRSLYVLEHGRVASKPEAAKWAMETLNEQWAGLIGVSLNWQDGKAFDKLEETLEFIRFTLCNSNVPFVDECYLEKKHGIN
jgi:predicted nucleotidyltransferase